ncbi:hypothetical protein GCM10027610_059420 [Dactylosporangium cerinum]
MATPHLFVEFSRQRGLSPDGRSRAFAAAADGVGWSEGGVVLLVERLADARRLGHPVLAVVRGSAVNSDGASNGLTAPNGPSQQRVIRAALADARLEASDVDLLEAHGTGTRLGDPIEAQALLDTYGADRPGGPLWLGTIKSNIGHTQAAAGLAGVAKAVLALRHATLPRTLHIDAPTPHVDWSAGTVRLLTEARPWPAGDRVRRAGVSAFGISGTNAHVLLEEAPAEPVTEAAAREPWAGATPWLLTAATPEALRARAAQLLDAGPRLDPRDVGFTLATGRARLAERAAVLAGDRDALRALAEDRAAPGLLRAETVAGPRVAALFTGQGAQRAGMGRELHRAFPVYAAAYDAVIDALPDGATVRRAADDGVHLDRTGFAQPALFALEVALFRLLESWGVRPELVSGHSVGELAAVHVAGVLSLPDAAALVSARGRLMQALPEGGAMLAVTAAEADVLAVLDGRPGVGLAAVNAPRATVVSGDEDVVAALADAFTARGWRHRRLRVSHAFHSARLDPILDELRAVAAGLRFETPALTVVSTLTGGPVTADELADPDYWARQARQPVRFADAVGHLVDAGATALVEVGPGEVLTGLAAQTTAERDGPGPVLVPALRVTGPETGAVALAAAQLAVHGVGVDWPAYFAGSGARLADLPGYPFQRQRYWLTAGRTSSGPAESVVRIAGTDRWLLTTRLSARHPGWLADHVVHGSVVVPGTAVLELVHRVTAAAGGGTVQELVVQRPLRLPARDQVEIQVTLDEPAGDGRRTVTLHARPDTEGGDDGWTPHATGTVGPAAAGPGFALTPWPPAGAEPVDPAGPAEALALAGLSYGPAFGGLRRIWRDGDTFYAEAELPGTVPAAEGLHPALFDAALHATAAAGDDPGIAALPYVWSGFRLHRPAGDRIRVRLDRTGAGRWSVQVADASGAPVAAVESLVLRPAPGSTTTPHRRCCRRGYRCRWTLRTPTRTGTSSGCRPPRTPAPR